MIKDVLGVTSRAKYWEDVAVQALTAESQQKTGEEPHYLVRHEGPNRHERRETDAILRRESRAKRDNRRENLLQRRKNQRKAKGR